MDTQDLIAKAKARIAELQQSIETLSTFITSAQAAEQLLTGTESSQRVVEAVSTFNSNEAPTITSNSIDTTPPSRTARVQGNPRPAVVIPAAIDIIRKKGHPLSRRALHEALSEQGIVVRGADPIKAFGTMLWRANDELINIEGRGYWPKADPIPDLGLDELLS